VTCDMVIGRIQWNGLVGAAIGGGMGFFVVSAFVSSALQLIVTDAAGIGVSGIVYALAFIVVRDPVSTVRSERSRRTMRCCSLMCGLSPGSS